MRLYRFTLPQANNLGLSMEDAISEFKEYALKLAGGYTVQPSVCGVWKGSDKTFFDHNSVVEIACNPATYKALLARVIALWPDQESFFVADIGQAFFVTPDRIQVAANAA